MPPEMTGEENTETKGTPPVSTKPKEGAGGSATDDAELEAGWDDKTKAYVQKLRNENKERRTSEKSLRDQFTKLETSQKEVRKALGLESDDEELTPAQKIEYLQNEIAQRDAHINFTNSAVSLGVTDQKDQRYLQYLIDEHMAEKEDGYEMSDEELDAIVDEVKARSTSQRGGGSTSFSGKKPPGAASGGGSGEITLEQFEKMTISEKGELYTKNEAQYLTLLGLQKQKKR